jgi:hypothetical protein
MAGKVNFEGKNIILPGVYSVVKSGIKNPPIALSYGNILIIDTGSGAAYGGGSGISGTLASGVDAIYPVDNIEDFRKLTKGGYWYVLAKPLFEPQPQPGVSGVSVVNYVRAATTVPAEMTFDPVGGGANGGTLIIQCRDEGLIGNGTLVSSELKKGYAYKLKAGVDDPAKFIIEFYLGTYTGLAADGYPYGDTAEADSKPLTVVTSREFTDFDDLVAWATDDAGFQSYFTIKSEVVAGDGSIDAADLITFTTYQVAISGTETFDAAALTATLTAVASLRYNFILSDKYGDDAEDANNDLLLSHVLDTNTSFEKSIFIGGGVDNTKFSQTSGSIPAAVHFNSDRVNVVHSGVKIPSSITPNKIRLWDSLYMTALVLGRICGLAPQTPGTFKTLPLVGTQHELTTKDMTTGLQAGVIMVHQDTQLLVPSYVILQAVTTIQNNLNQVNEDGTTREISIRRIAAQLNLELAINARKDLLGNEDGPNLFTLTDRTLIDWTSGQLQFRTAQGTTDNLIIAYKNISVTTSQDAKFVTYEFKPNGPVNKFFLTGFMVN